LALDLISFPLASSRDCGKRWFQLTHRAQYQPGGCGPAVWAQFGSCHLAVIVAATSTRLPSPVPHQTQTVAVANGSGGGGGGGGGAGAIVVAIHEKIQGCGRRIRQIQMLKICNPI